MKFEVRDTSAGKSTTTVVVCDGHIDDAINQDLNELRSKLKHRDVTFDCEKIRTLNSIGIGAWISFLRDLSKTHEFTFTRCPVSFVHACNMVSGMLGNGRMESCFVPYTCRPCNGTVLQLTTLKDRDPADEFAAIPCPKCTDPKCPKAISAEESAEEYLAFMAK